jgi:hypothetical protein
MNSYLEILSIITKYNIENKPIIYKTGEKKKIIPKIQNVSENKNKIK